MSSGEFRAILYHTYEAFQIYPIVPVAAGNRAPLIAIGAFTDRQVADIEVERRGLGLNEIADKEIVFIGRHLHTSRAKDGYTIGDILRQIESALAPGSIVIVNPKVTARQNPRTQDDGYGDAVHDRAIFELTQRKPRAALFSVILKGDIDPPKNAKGPPVGEP